MNQQSNATGLEEQVRRLAKKVGGLSGLTEALALPLDADHHAAMTSHLVRRTCSNTKTPANVSLPQSAPARRASFLSRHPPAPASHRYLKRELFADSAWDILLDLAAARAEHCLVSLTSLCISASIPATSALRWITQLTGMGILVREPDADDRRRRAFIALSDRAAAAITQHFKELGQRAVRHI